MIWATTRRVLRKSSSGGGPDSKEAMYVAHLASSIELQPVKDRFHDRFDHEGGFHNVHRYLGGVSGDAAYVVAHAHTDVEEEAMFLHAEMEAGLYCRLDAFVLDEDALASVSDQTLFPDVEHVSDCMDDLVHDVLWYPPLAADAHHLRRYVMVHN